MKAEIITIGDEILIGQIVDTNSKWIAEELNKIGVSVYQITSIQDDKSHILKALKEAESNADIVILTGGLGPTKDDITKHTLAEYFESDLTMNKDVEEHIRNLFKKINYPFTEVNRQQALLPNKCTSLKNNYGTASGIWFDSKNKVVISLPGVPNEMKGLMLDEVLPRIQKKYTLPYIIHKTVMTYGMGESMVAEKIEDWEEALPPFIKLAYLPAYGSLRLRLSANGDDKNILEDTLKSEISKLYLIIGDIIVGLEETASIEASVGKLLTDRKMTISTAESCTGGDIAKKMTSVPGASNYFVGSVIAYSPKIKINELQVDKQLIEKHSIVSAAVAKAMVVGIQKKYKTDYAIATTGNAGPTTDKTDKTVGVVFIAIATPNGVFVEEFFFGKPRQKVIERTTNKSLELLRKEILKNC